MQPLLALADTSIIRYSKIWGGVFCQKPPLGRKPNGQWLTFIKSLLLYRSSFFIGGLASQSCGFFCFKCCYLLIKNGGFGQKLFPLLRKGFPRSENSLRRSFGPPPKPPFEVVIYIVNFCWYLQVEI